MKYTHPAEIPISKSLLFDWVSDRAESVSQNIGGDTYPMTWADDDEIYVGTGDPGWVSENGHNRVCSIAESRDSSLYQACSGLAVEKFTGDPGSFSVKRVNDMDGYIGPGGFGCKPSGMICVDGKLYFAAQNLLGHKMPRFRGKSQHGDDAAILCSGDHGKTWAPDLNGLLTRLENEQFDRRTFQWKTRPERRASYDGWNPMFPGNLFGGPSFIQFGRNNADAVDAYVYAVSADHWDNGRDLRLGRVKNDRIMNCADWEFAVLDEDGNVGWTRSLEDSKPILEIDCHISLPEMVYIKSLKKYVLLTWALHADFRTNIGSELTILEADNPWGPFSLVHYEWLWDDRDCCPYTPRLPLKWFDSGKLEGYILYSGNWETNCGYYIPHLKKFKFTRRTTDSGGFQANPEY